MSRILVLSLVACLAMTAIAYGANKTVILKDGRKISGEVTKTDSGYSVKTDGGEVQFKDSEVASVVDAADIQKEYQDRLAKIDDKDANAHFELAVWAEQNAAPDIAMKEVLRSLELNPDSEKAQVLKRKLEAAARATSTPPEPKTKPANGTNQTGGAAGLDIKDLVTDEDITKIRFWEVHKKDPGVSIDFSNNALKRFIEGQAMEPKDEKSFRALSRSEQLVYIRETSGQDRLMEDIIVKSDPTAIKEFRAVWPGIEQNCAVADCHGGPKGKGQLKLFPRGKAPNEKADYTNFLILSLWEKDGRRLIDRQRPEDSLLLQYGLPVKDAEFDHPGKHSAVMFSSKKAPNYKKLDEFIRGLEGPKTPNYGTKYQPPVGRKLGEPTTDTQPAEAPAK